MLGQKVLFKNASIATTQLDVSGLNSGTYLLKTQVGTASKILKVVKK